VTDEPVAVDERGPPDESASAPSPVALPQPPSRAALALYRVCWTAVQAIIRSYWRVRCDGAEHLPAGGPFVLAPVHRSFLDFALISCLTPRRLRYMGKESLWAGWKPFAAFLSALGAFPVRRGSADREALRRCMAVIGEGDPLVLFPEGTRRSGPVVEDLWEGAAYVAIRTGVPIVPVGIGGSERAMRKGERVPRPVKVHVIAGPPLMPPRVEEGKRPSRRARQELTEQLRVELQRLFDLAQERAGVRAPR
jgi:1-acyl-sn-glycerol-3-phosphate acyltransferase